MLFLRIDYMHTQRTVDNIGIPCRKYLGWVISQANHHECSHQH